MRWLWLSVAWGIIGYHAAASDVQVGAASVDITPEIGVPLAGFGSTKRRALSSLWGAPFATFFAPSEGKRDPIRSKVFVVKQNNKLLVFVSLDVIGVDARMTRAIKRRFNLQDGELVLTATHTHSGPGTLSDNWFWEYAVSDRYQPRIYKKFLNQVFLSVELALSRLRPAQVFYAATDLEGVQKNRRNIPGHFDSRAHFILAKDQDAEKIIGGLVNFPLHGTALGSKNLHFSADVLGAIERGLESATESGEATTFLFLNGAEADVTPAHKKTDGMDLIAQAVLTKFKQLDFKEIEPDWSFKSVQVDLGPPALRVANCDSALEWMSKAQISLDLAFPQQADLGVLSWDNLSLVLWPGEATTQLGKEVALNNFGRDTLFIGLANDYLGYFTTPEEYLSGGYEACASFYGVDGGAKIVAALIDLMRGKE